MNNPSDTRIVNIAWKLVMSFLSPHNAKCNFKIYNFDTVTECDNADVLFSNSQKRY